MSDILEIKRKAPENKSMNYSFLREEGIKYIQELSSKIWTDYNVHDPGITILEALCYAITDLGNRASYSIEDIIAIKETNSSGDDKIKNFYKAEQILPNAPLTINDFRKLLMDIQIEVPVPGLGTTEFVGVKNAWLKKASDAEEGFYLHKSESLLSYDKDVTLGTDTEQKTLYAGNLYEVLLEFSHSNHYDDLNQNKIDGYLTIYDNPDDTNLEGLIVSIDITLPRWDAEDLDWDNPDEIKANIQKIKVDFINLPNNYELKANIDSDFNISLEGTEMLSGGEEKLTNLGSIEDKINAFLYDELDEESLILVYQQKIFIIEQILDEVEKTLNANRNLCDDFLAPGALKIEEIGICADIQVEPDSNIEELLAQVYYYIGKFLSPTINFYTFSEMLDLCISEESYAIKEIGIDDGLFTVNADLTEKLQAGDTITIKNSLSNNADYTVVSVNLNNLNNAYSDVYVDEDIASDVLTENESFTFKVTNEKNCLTVDQIFEGPLLKHGFINNNELEDADLMEVIHVSDLIQIIMDIPGITAVRNLEIASYPEAPDYDTELKSVKWVLELLYKDNYVPRLSTDKSTVVFYKDQIPYKANNKDVEDLVNELIVGDRPQKLTPPVIYPRVPKGTFTDLSEYTSIQEDFPLHFGIGFEGIPNLANLSDEEQLKKIGQTKQLKGYLMFFDQLLANYLAQLANVKYLFSMNAEKDENGEYEIGRTYYTQALFSCVSDSDPLYINKEGHQAELELIAENEALFNTRRNKFLDHLLARFAENFTDYAMLVTRLSGNKAPRELIDDKLNFLNRYPEISANRGLAMNYQNNCKFWHKSNKSGLENRSALLMGIPGAKSEDLVFSSGFKITQAGELYNISIVSGTDTLLIGSDAYPSREKAGETMETILMLSVQENNYDIVSEDGINYAFNLMCEDEVLATSYKTGYSSPANAWADVEALISLCKNEFFNNHESNRNNLTPPIDNYFEYTYTLVSDSKNYYDVVANLYRTAFEFTPENKMLTCVFQIDEKDVEDEKDLKKAIKELIWKTIVHCTIPEYYIFSYPNAGTVPDPDYVFQITDRNSAVLATSIETNFNEKLVSNINSLNNPAVKISGSSNNDGYYTIGSSDADGPNVIINIPVTLPIPSTTTDGNLSVTATYSCEFHASEKYLSIDQDITAYLFEYDIVVLVHDDNTETYCVVDETSFIDGKTKITTNNPLPSGPSGTLCVYPTYAYSLDADNKTFTIDEDITGAYGTDDILSMWEENAPKQTFTIKSMARYGDKTQIVVKESIDEDPRGRISFTKIYPQVRIDTSSSSGNPNAFTIKGGEDIKAAQEMIEFIKSRFTENEGIHLIEHVLLRPKNNISIPLLHGELTIYGQVIFEVPVPVIVNDSTSETIGVQGNITTDIYVSPDSRTITIHIEGFAFEVSFECMEYVSAEGITYFDLAGIYPSELASAEDALNLVYQSSVNIANIEEENQKVLPEPTAHTFAPGEQISIIGSEDALNDGTYTIESVEANGFTIVLEKLQDKLLPVFLSNDCSSYNLSNPYTSIATAVLPYWPERFNDMDFRNFFEKTLRMETPSHVLLKICWANPMHMEDFERAYKTWLLANNDIGATQQEISEALSQVIDAVDQLRNVYPVGTLYDPDEHETLKNTIILDNTMLGSF